MYEETNPPQAFFLIGTLLTATAAERPNVVLIVSDDQGYADISAYDHPGEVATPNLDRIAQQGVRFTNGYASAYVCAPTRAGLLTGRYQQRFGFYTASDSRIGLPLTEITIADLLSREGYVTGVFGKWRVGLDPEYHPLARGFDTFYGFLGHGAHDYFKLQRTSPHNSIYRDREIIDDTGYLTGNLAREATAFIEQNRGKLFFLYLPFNAVLDTLSKHGLTDNTLVIFFSDNGGHLRDYKQCVYEGGVRVPFLMSWPARIPKGVVNSEPVISLDAFPTICAATGAKLPGDRACESKAPLHQALFWDGDQQRQAVRADLSKQWRSQMTPRLQN